MPRLTPYAAHEIAMVSSTPAGSGFPIGLMPGALPSDHASRQTLKTTAVRLPLGHSQFTGWVMPRHAPRFPRGILISGQGGVGKGASSGGATCATSPAPLPTLSDLAIRPREQSRVRPAHHRMLCTRLCPPYTFMLGS